MIQHSIMRKFPQKISKCQLWLVNAAQGADILSKWVGEAERMLRLLFAEAERCQPSIIFFDEIDGLAPVCCFPITRTGTRSGRCFELCLRLLQR